ncbi:MAG: hypothetical protein ACLFQK_08780 [Fibrobacterota bacterium]
MDYKGRKIRAIYEKKLEAIANGRRGRKVPAKFFIIYFLIMLIVVLLTRGKVGPSNTIDFKKEGAALIMSADEKSMAAVLVSYGENKKQKPFSALLDYHGEPAVDSVLQNTGGVKNSIDLREMSCLSKDGWLEPGENISVQKICSGEKTEGIFYFLIYSSKILVFPAGEYNHSVLLEKFLLTHSRCDYIIYGKSAVSAETASIFKDLNPRMVFVYKEYPKHKSYKTLNFVSLGKEKRPVMLSFFKDADEGWLKKL